MFLSPPTILSVFTLSLPAALPICRQDDRRARVLVRALVVVGVAPLDEVVGRREDGVRAERGEEGRDPFLVDAPGADASSEEHTYEPQPHSEIVWRPVLEKRNYRLQ